MNNKISKNLVRVPTLWLKCFSRCLGKIPGFPRMQTASIPPLTAALSPPKFHCVVKYTSVYHHNTMATSFYEFFFWHTDMTNTLECDILNDIRIHDGLSSTTYYYYFRCRCYQITISWPQVKYWAQAIHKTTQDTTL